ncbi:MAG: HAMP domain-containing histidine kinase [Clostridia bacterium]|nr:HAMP domain-containing histidine kinase [Clostridia bacterium]
MRRIKTTTSNVLSRGYYQDASLEESGYLLVYVKGSTFFVKRSATYTEKEQKNIIQTMVNSDSEIFDCDGRFFYYDYVYVEDGATLYAAYNLTAELKTLRALTIILILADVLCALLGGIIGWLCSKSIFAPLKVALDKQSELIANASHELKTPLAVISAQTELVKSEVNDEKTMKWLEGIETQTKRMETLIREMLELSKLEANKKVVVEEVDVSDLVESVCLTMEAPCFEKNVELKTEINPDIKMTTDRAKLEKLITILFDNAVKYTSGGGEIAVTLEKKKNLVFSIRNTGEGIEKDKIDKIFDRFYRQDESHSDNGSSFGLGLAIAKSLVEAMQGSITCESVVNEYTKFIVVLPNA